MDSECCDKINPIGNAKISTKRPSLPAKTQKTTANESQPNFN